MSNLNLFGLSLTPERLRVALIVFFIAIFGYNVYSGVWPQVEAYLGKRGEIEQQQQQIEAAKGLIGTREQIEARYRTVRANLAAIQDRFPQRNQILSILLVDLSEIFRDTGTFLSNFEPLGFKPLEQEALRNLGRMQIKISARGEYPSIILLFDRLSKYERVLRIETPQIGPRGGAEAAPAGEEGAAAEPAAAAPAGPGFNRTLDVTFTLTTYALNR